jgi:hypothetical protein
VTGGRRPVVSILVQDGTMQDGTMQDGTMQDAVMAHGTDASTP